jgi:hypothetical protein
MKKHIVLIVAIAILSVMGLQVQAQQDTPVSAEKLNRLLISPFSIFDGTLALSYERLLPFGDALRITPIVILSNGFLRGGTRSGVGIDVGYKLQSLAGLPNVYVAPYFMYKQLERAVVHADDIVFGASTSIPLTSSTITVYGVGVDAGVNYIIGWFITDFTLGFGMRYPVLSNKRFESLARFQSNDDYKGIMPRIKITIGLMF